jgi:WS/DGAT C-terminal domain
VELVPYVPIAATLRTGISIFSYCGNLTFGVTGDYATTPDLDILARGITEGIAELLAAARQCQSAHNGCGAGRSASRDS